MTSRPRAYSYIRFSTPEQQNGDSFRRQFELSKAYADLHGLDLDERLSYRDLGVSAFDSTNIEGGQLGVFLRAVESGEITRGSYLLVESLDRLSRAKISDALSVFLSLVQKGITIVTLADEMIYSKDKIDAQFTDLIISVAIMSRAHEESMMKSKRLRAAWANKRKNIQKKKLTAIAPAWLRLSEDSTEYTPVPERVQIVQRIFHQAKSGIGALTITRRLNQEGISSISDKATSWNLSYVKKILGMRAVLGEFQPHVTVNGNREPEGDPVADYFPRIISDEDFLLTSASIQSRRSGSAGRKGVGLSNLFSGILRCGYCGSSMTMLNKGHTGPRSKLIVCSAAKMGKDCYYIPWEYSAFEQSILTYCTGLDIRHFLNADTSIQTEIHTLEIQLISAKQTIAGIDQKLQNITDAITVGGEALPPLLSRMKELHNDRVEKEASLQAIQQNYENAVRAQVDVADVQATIFNLLSKMEDLPEDRRYDFRAELSQQIKRLVSTIKVYGGGNMDTPKYISALRRHLLANGHTASDVETHISTKLKTSPNVNERFFITGSRSGNIRMIQPSSDDPEILHFNSPGSDLRMNVEAITDSIGVLVDVLKTKKPREVALKTSE